MMVSTQGEALIKSFESFQSRAYWDGTYWPGIDGGKTSKRFSIGWGTTIIDGVRVAENECISEERAEECFCHDLLIAVQWVETCVKVSLNQYQIDALTSLAYNCHPPATATIWKVINRGEGDIRYQFLSWTKAHINGVEQTLPGLVHRRMLEYCVFKTGNYYDRAPWKLTS